MNIRAVRIPLERFDSETTMENVPIGSVVHDVYEEYDAMCINIGTETTVGPLRDMWFNLLGNNGALRVCAATDDVIDI